MTARAGVIATGVIALLAVSALAQPNVIVILTDDQGYGDLSCYGSTTIRTPRLDRLAAEGTRFTSFYAQCVCGPSRSALLTGREPVRSGGWSMPANEVTVAELLRARGYTTGCLGKWDVSNRAPIPGRMPNGQGFDYFYGSLGGPDNGYDGEYAGFTQLTSLNAGTPFVQGWEFSYQQQFTFLPGLLKGLGVAANYTVLDTHGNFGGPDSLRSGEVVGFIPRTGNASVSWRYRRFNARVLFNFTSDYTSSYSRTALALNTYRLARSIINTSFAYQVRPTLSLTLDIDNITNEPQVFYRAYRDRVQSHVVNGITLNLGVSGRF